MKPTWEESSDLKQALKREPVTADLEAEAEEFPLEADEAYFEVIDGRDTVEPGSWVAQQIGRQGAMPRAA